MPTTGNAATATTAVTQEVAADESGHGEGDTRPRQSDTEEGVATVTMTVPAPPSRPASSTTLASHQGDLPTDLGDTTEDESGNNWRCCTVYRGVHYVLVASIIPKTGVKVFYFIFLIPR